MSDQSPRSAFEIAMDRLREKGAQDGIEYQPRTEKQKVAITEVRSVYDAKLGNEVCGLLRKQERHPSIVDRMRSTRRPDVLIRT